MIKFLRVELILGVLFSLSLILSCVGSEEKESGRVLKISIMPEDSILVWPRSNVSIYQEDSTDEGVLFEGKVGNPKDLENLIISDKIGKNFIVVMKAYDDEGRLRYHKVLRFEDSRFVKKEIFPITIVSNPVDTSSGQNQFPNRPPFWGIMNSQIRNMGDTIEIRLIASDPDGDSLVFSANDLPENAVLKKDRIVFIPAPNQIGKIAFSVGVKDYRGDLVPNQVFITILPRFAPTPPQVAGPSESLQRSRSAIWKWKSGGAGSGVFQYALGFDSTFALKTSESRDTIFQANGLKDGKHTFWIREKTAFGEWTEFSSVSFEIDSTPPSIILTLPNPLIHPLKKAYSTPVLGRDLKAIDDREGDLSSKIKVKRNVNVEISGTYHEIFHVSDALGNADSLSREVRVVGWQAHSPLADTVLRGLRLDGKGNLFVATQTNGYDLTVRMKYPASDVWKVIAEYDFSEARHPMAPLNFNEISFLSMKSDAVGDVWLGFGGGSRFRIRNLSSGGEEYRSVDGFDFAVSSSGYLYVSSSSVNQAGFFVPSIRRIAIGAREGDTIWQDLGEIQDLAGNRHFLENVEGDVYCFGKGAGITKACIIRGSSISQTKTIANLNLLSVKAWGGKVYALLDSGKTVLEGKENAWRDISANLPSFFAGGNLLLSFDASECGLNALVKSLSDSFSIRAVGFRNEKWNDMPLAGGMLDGSRFFSESGNLWAVSSAFSTCSEGNHFAGLKFSSGAFNRVVKEKHRIFWLKE